MEEKENRLAILALIFSIALLTVSILAFETNRSTSIFSVIAALSVGITLISRMNKSNSPDEGKSKVQSFKTQLKTFLKGLSMGLADIIPGISGGTVALIEGIYERLISAIKSINLEFILYALETPIDREKWTKAKKRFLDIDFKFLIPLGIGMITAFLAAARGINFLINEFTVQIYSFFFVLILLSAGIIYRRVQEINLKTFIPGIFGFLFAIIFLGLEGGNIPNTLPIIFVTGFLAISTMILPGISGSFVVLFLGQYEYMLNALSSISTHGLDVATFILGGIVSLLSFSRVLNHLLKNYYSHTIFFLAGLMLGGLRLPAEKIIGTEGLLNQPLTIITSIIAGAIGVLIIAVAESQREEDGEETIEAPF